MRDEIAINRRSIGSNNPVYVIAEMSANHNGSYQRAEEIIKRAKDAGADAVKLQTYTADTMTIDCEGDEFRVNGTIWGDKKLYELYSLGGMPWEWHPKLQEVAERVEIDLLSTPYDITAVEFLESLNVPAYKVASFELIDLHLLKRIAETGKPIILSTGMATYEEVSAAVNAIRDAGGVEVALLKCTSAYPAPLDEINLRTICDMSDSFKVPVGISDHSLDDVVAVGAVALGACIIEKHFTISREGGGIDDSFSMEPNEFSNMVRRVRELEVAIGSVNYEVTNKQKICRKFRRSLYVVRSVKKGEVFTVDNVRSIRPAKGLNPKYYEMVLGKVAAREIERGEPLSWDMVVHDMSI